MPTPLYNAIRDYWDARPCNIRHSDQPVGTRAYFDAVELRKYRVEPHILGFADFGRWKGKAVLEIGCGIGTDTVNFARFGAHVTALDLSPAAVEITRQRAAVYDLPVTVLEGNIEYPNHGLTAGTFDLVYAFGVLHHIPDIETALDKIYAFLNVGGMFKLMVYHRWSWKNLLVHLRLAQPEAQVRCPIYNTYSQRDMRTLLEQAGFTVERITVEHIFPWRIAEYVSYQYVKAWPWRIMPPRLFRWLEHRIGFHLCITARKN